MMQNHAILIMCIDNNLILGQIYETNSNIPQHLFRVLEHIFKALSGRDYIMQHIIRFLSPLQKMCACFCLKSLLSYTRSLKWMLYSDPVYLSTQH